MKQLIQCECGNKIIMNDNQNVIVRCHCGKPFKIISKNKSTNRIEQLLKKKSSLLALIALKKESLLKIKCKSCSKVSSGDFQSNYLVCSYCRSVNIELLTPIIKPNDKKQAEPSEKELHKIINEYTKLNKLQVAIKHLYQILKEISVFSENLNHDNQEDLNKAINSIYSATLHIERMIVRGF